MDIIISENAPKAIGPYSQAVQVGDMLYASGQIPLDPKTMEVVGDNIIEQTNQVFKNIKGLLVDSGLDLDKVVKTTCFLKDMNDFAKFNEVYSSYFSAPFPSRSCVAVKTLPKDVLVEIEVIAHF